jgi:hypothetical protein
MLLEMATINAMTELAIMKRYHRRRCVVVEALYYKPEGRLFETR